MFKNIRRNSKQLFEPRRKSLATIDPPPHVPDEPIPDPPPPSTLTFFSLPAEIRNTIYELLAASTTITIVPVSPLAAKPKPKKSPTFMSKPPAPPPDIPSLLLTTHQTRSEYLPLLLSLAPLTATVKDFDFRPLTRTLSSLYATELRALRTNPDILIRLQIDKVSRDSLAGLRRWITKRAESIDRIPLRYSILWPKERQIIPTSSQVHRINVYIHRRTLLNQGLNGMSALKREVGEVVGIELEGVAAALLRELEIVRAVDVDLGGVATGWHEDARMLMYGIPIARNFH